MYRQVLDKDTVSKLVVLLFQMYVKIIIRFDVSDVILIFVLTDQ